jgi:hypothetical protein
VRSTTEPAAEHIYQDVFAIGTPADTTEGAKVGFESLDQSLVSEINNPELSICRYNCHMLQIWRECKCVDRLPGDMPM